MRILSLISSYRKNGNTVKLLQILEYTIVSISNQRNIQVDVETVFLGHQNILTCKGCRKCFDKGEKNCPLNDDLLSIKEKLSEVDLVILASPVYVEDVNGIMKNWIDRMAFVCHRPEFFGKSAYILSTSGMGSTKHTLMTMNTALRTWGFHIIGQDTFKTGVLMKKEEMVSLYQKKINQTANKILKNIQLDMSSKPSFVSLMIFKIQQLYYKKEKVKDSLDYLYWYNNGWLDQTCIYYIKNKSNAIKIILARFWGFIIARMVLK